MRWRHSILLAAALLAACSVQPKRETWAVVVSVAEDANPKFKPDEVIVTARSSSGAMGSISVRIGRLTCRAGDTVHGSERGLALTLDAGVCER